MRYDTAFRVQGTASLTSSVDAIDIKLTEEEIKYLEEPYQATAIFGHS